MYVSFGKRVCDIVVGLVALPFVLLIIAVLAPFIHFEDKGPVFYNAPGAISRCTSCARCG